MIRVYAKVLSLHQRDDYTEVTLRVMSEGYVHTKSDNFEDTAVFPEAKDITIKFSKGFEQEFVVGQVSMIDWFRVPPEGWRK